MNERILQKRLEGKKICIYGTGVYGVTLAIYLDQIGGGYKVISFCDSNKEKWGKQIYKDIYCDSPERINKDNVVCIAVDRKEHEREILKRCQKLQLETVTELKTFLTEYMSHIDDETFIKAVWFSKMGYSLDLDHPNTFNEKIQWIKLYDRDPQYIKLVDKYEVKQFVADVIGKQYIIPTLGVYDTFDEIDFNKLPNQFVLKCTHDSGSVILCKDKACLDMEDTKNRLTECLKKNFSLNGREWAYQKVKPRIIAEEYISQIDGNLYDYKIHCFGGKPVCIQLIGNRNMETHTGSQAFYDINWNLQPFTLGDYPLYKETIEKPAYLNTMVHIAEKLSEGLRYARIDLYNVEGKIYFGEVTLYPASGYYPYFSPNEANIEWGKMIVIDDAVSATD